MNLEEDLLKFLLIPKTLTLMPRVLLYFTIFLRGFFLFDCKSLEVLDQGNDKVVLKLSLYAIFETH